MTILLYEEQSGVGTFHLCYVPLLERSQTFSLDKIKMGMAMVNAKMFKSSW